MARIETWVNCDLKKTVQVHRVTGNVFTLDNLGNLVGVRVYDDGQPVTLAGTVNGYCILADGTTVPVAGSRSGNTAYIILPQSAYAVPGIIKIMIKLTESSVITTLAAVIGTVAKSRTDQIIEPSQQVITDWSQQIAAEMQAVEDASAAQDTKIDDLKGVFDYNGRSSSFAFPTKKKSEFGDITFTWNSDFSECTVSGSSPNVGFNNILALNELPFGKKPGDKIYIRFRTTDDQVFYYLYWRVDGVSGSPIKGTKGEDLVIPSGINGIALQLRTPKNASFTEEAKVTIDIYSEVPAGETSAINDTLKKQMTDIYSYNAVSIVNALGYINNIINHNVSFEWTDAHTCVIKSGTGGTDGSAAICNFLLSEPLEYPIVAGEDVYIKYTSTGDNIRLNIFENSTGSAVSHKFYGDAIYRIPAGTTRVSFRLETKNLASGSTIDETVTVDVLNAKTNKELQEELENTASKFNALKVLFIGNSYTANSVGYTPYIINSISKGIRVTIGATYYSGATIDDQISLFNEDTGYETVTEYNKYTYAGESYDNPWVTYKAANNNEKTLKECIADEPWDMIVFQQGSTYQGDWSTFGNLNTLIDDVVSYYTSVYSKSVKLGWLFPQLRYSKTVSDPDHYDDVVNCVKNVLETTPIQYFFPAGTAIQNARETQLDALGVEGHLCRDSQGHLQHGIPVLISSYVIALKLLELSGESYVGILGEATDPTTEWKESRNCPGGHGTTGQSASVGTGDFGKRFIAQKCAVNAIKFPTTITTIEST